MSEQETTAVALETAVYELGIARGNEHAADAARRDAVYELGTARAARQEAELNSLCAACDYLAARGEPPSARILAETAIVSKGVFFSRLVQAAMGGHLTLPQILEWFACEP